MILFDCLYSVDVFFWIGGFFLSFVMIESKKAALIKKQGVASFFGAIFHILAMDLDGLGFSIQ